VIDVVPPDALAGVFGWAAPRLLVLFGIGFLFANLRLGLDLLRYQRRRRATLLVWPGQRPRFYGLNLGLGVVFAVLIVIKAFVLRRPLDQLFGESMMLLYYGYLFPLSVRIERGFYRDGVWADSGFLHWADVSAVSWKDGRPITLVLISDRRHVGRRLEVPGPMYGEVRRLLRDRIQTQGLHIGGAGLDLGSRDDRDTV
jgi:hypothetical protein